MASSDTSLSGLSELAGIGTSIGDVFINLSSEYPALLDTIILIFAVIGIFIASYAVFDFIKMGKRDQMQESPAKAIMWRLISGGVLVDLAFWAKVTTGTVWNADPLGISSYTGNSNGDYGQTALMAAIGFIVLAGYVVLGKAFVMTGKMGYLSPDARSDLGWSIIARIISGGTMIACMNVAQYLNNSTGFNWIPS